MLPPCGCSSSSSSSSRRVDVAVRVVTMCLRRCAARRCRPGLPPRWDQCGWRRRPPPRASCHHRSRLCSRRATLLPTMTTTTRPTAYALTVCAMCSVLQQSWRLRCRRNLAAPLCVCAQGSHGGRGTASSRARGVADAAAAASLAAANAAASEAEAKLAELTLRYRELQRHSQEQVRPRRLLSPPPLLHVVVVAVTPSRRWLCVRCSLTPCERTTARKSARCTARWRSVSARR